MNVKFHFSFHYTQTTSVTFEKKSGENGLFLLKDFILICVYAPQRHSASGTITSNGMLFFLPTCLSQDMKEILLQSNYC